MCFLLSAAHEPRIPTSIGGEFLHLQRPQQWAAAQPPRLGLFFPPRQSFVGSCHGNGTDWPLCAGTARPARTNTGLMVSLNHLFHWPFQLGHAKVHTQSRVSLTCVSFPRFPQVSKASRDLLPDRAGDFAILDKHPGVWSCLRFTVSCVQNGYGDLAGCPRQLHSVQGGLRQTRKVHGSLRGISERPKGARGPQGPRLHIRPATSPLAGAPANNHGACIPP